ncbi:M23 family metallopeptidase [Massiliimalia massiliensis]|uniref:M23 family metallopeptidase n=1 Tax=Massiliimalia massiliensis TaxID=1852384 RepID=UPI001E3CB0FD|nr:M23 family metallopeptidase [Massiliimalia massiliensis]
MKQWMRETVAFVLILLIAVTGIACFYPEKAVPAEGYITWAGFDVPVEAMQKAGQADIDSYQEENHVDWVESLACLAVQYGGNWKQYRGKDLDGIIQKAKAGTLPEEQAKSNKKGYTYYENVYRAVLDGFIGEYQHELIGEDGESTIVSDYGVKVFSPIAGGYGYNHYDDFGAGRSYGFRRNHLGNDLLGNVGTPIIAVESGVIEAMGWNEFGGWRIGIRSLDQKRYYYYAHLRSGHPYVFSRSVGDTVQAGDVIGYLGMTGYSSKEDTNGMTKPHLHFGMELIFDESQKESDQEIWINVYEIVKFLSKHRSAVCKDEKTGEYVRQSAYYDSSLENSESLCYNEDETSG